PSCVGPIVDTTAGTVNYGCNTFGLTPTGPTGSGTLSTITFNALQPGHSALNISVAGLSTEDGTTIDVTSLNNGTVDITAGTPAATFTPSATPTITPTGTATLPVTPTPTGIAPPGSCGPQIAAAL